MGKEATASSSDDKGGQLLKKGDVLDDELLDADPAQVLARDRRSTAQSRTSSASAVVERFEEQQGARRSCSSTRRSPA